MNAETKLEMVAERATNPTPEVSKYTCADHAYWNYQNFLAARRQVKMWRFTCNVDREMEQLKSNRKAMWEWLRKGGFPNISQAIQYRRENKPAKPVKK